MTTDKRVCSGSFDPESRRFGVVLLSAMSLALNRDPITNEDVFGDAQNNGGILNLTIIGHTARKPSVTVCDAISFQHLSDCHRDTFTARRFVDNIPHPFVLSFLSRLQWLTFQHNNTQEV